MEKNLNSGIWDKHPRSANLQIEYFNEFLMKVEKRPAMTWQAKKMLQGKWKENREIIIDAVGKL